MERHELLERGHPVLCSFLHPCVEAGVLELCHELAVVDLSVLVSVKFEHERIDLPGREPQPELPDRVPELHLGDVPIAILIEISEDLIEAHRRRLNDHTQPFHDVFVPGARARCRGLNSGS